MQVDCIYNQEEAVDVTGAPAADLLSDMKERCMAIFVQGHVSSSRNRQRNHERGHAANGGSIPVPAWLNGLSMQGCGGSAGLLQGLFQ